MLNIYRALAHPDMARTHRHSTRTHKCAHTRTHGGLWGQCHPEPKLWVRLCPCAWAPATLASVPQLCLELAVRFGELLPLWPPHYNKGASGTWNHSSQRVFPCLSLLKTLSLGFMYCSHSSSVTPILSWNFLHKYRPRPRSVLRSLPPFFFFFYIFLRSSHSFPSLIVTLLCINRTKVRWLMHKRHLGLHLSPASTNRRTLLTMTSCLAKRLPPIPGFTSAGLLVYWILSAPSHLCWANFWSFPFPSALSPVC